MRSRIVVGVDGSAGTALNTAVAATMSVPSSRR